MNKLSEQDVEEFFKTIKRKKQLRDAYIEIGTCHNMHVDKDTILTYPRNL